MHRLAGLASHGVAAQRASANRQTGAPGRRIVPRRELRMLSMSDSDNVSRAKPVFLVHTCILAPLREAVPPGREGDFSR